ncbi:MAG: hypothetical protein NC253_15465 [Ruminococcus sp.]|nr:hypothetical protein [Ruminococcus sp.]MCM1479365.1 hypothetical protein [Muribaculaceae bacterium]
MANMEPANLPEKAATAFSEVTVGMVGAKYIPVLYCGEQLVNGTNYMIICKQTLATNPPAEHLVTMIINCSEQGCCIVNIEQIV